MRNLKKEKPGYRQRDQIGSYYRQGVVSGRNGYRWSKRCKLLGAKQITTERHSMMAIVNAVVWYTPKVVKTIDPKSSHHKGKKNIFVYLDKTIDVY